MNVQFSWYTLGVNVFILVPFLWCDMRQSVLLKKLGAKIRLRRYDSGFTQMKLAEMSGCSLQAIGNIERGKANLSITMLYKIANALDISARDLLP